MNFNFGLIVGLSQYMQAKVGDTVRFLNSVGGGTLVRIEGQMAYVDDDGFETPVLLRECVTVASANSFVPPTTGPAARQQAKTPVAAPSRTSAPNKCADSTPKGMHTEANSDELPYIETKAGEQLNVVLGFEPQNVHRLSESNLDVSLVNDSNYYLYLILLCRADSAQPWTTLYAGLIQPGIQQLCTELDRSQLNQLENLAVQYVAYKKKGASELKAPVSVQWRMDVTKLAKLHCFKRHRYFDNPVVAFEITRDGRPGMTKALEIDPQALSAAMTQPNATAKSQKGPTTSKPSQARRAATAEPLVIDLHANEILPDQRGLKPGDILQYQLAYFREVMDSQLRNHGQKIIFIHGKGDGVLRQNLLRELQHRYKDHDVQDASFREYGFGATQVTIK